MSGNVVPAPTGRLARWRRPIGYALTAISLIAIAILTLSPQVVGVPETFGHWCIVCGTIGGSDVVANVLLFVPFGFGLAVAGLSGRRAAIVGLLLSASIELAQLVVPGRYATLSDVLTNTAGTALAAALVSHRRTWLRPLPRSAAVLGALAAATFVAVQAAGAWAFGTADDRGGPAPVIDRSVLPTGMGWFSGEVVRAQVDDYVVAHRGTGPVTIAAPARQTTHVAVELSGFDPRESLVPLLFVHRPGDAEPWIVLGQKARQLVVEPSFRGRALRLRRPRLSVRRIGGWRHQPEATFLLEAEVTSNRLTLSVEQRGIRHTETVRIAPTLAWALLSPFPRIGDPEAPLATMAWLAGLAAPVGYYARWTGRTRRRGEMIAMGAVLAALVAGLVVVPWVAGFAPARPWEWLGALCGAIAGAGLAEGVRRTR